MTREIRGRRGAFVYTVLLSLLIHLLIFLGVSLDVLWPKGVSAKKPLPIRIVSVDQPKPDKRLPLNPDSRFLSNANRRESGAAKPGAKPRLRREEKDRIPARRGTQNPAVASLSPPPSPRVLPQPEPVSPVIQKETPRRKRQTTPPKPQVKNPAPPKPKTGKKPGPVVKESQAPRPVPKEQERSAPASPAERTAKPALPKSIENARSALAEKKPLPVKKPVPEKVKKRTEKPRPQKRRAEKKTPEIKIAREREKTKRPPLPEKKPVKKKTAKKKTEKPKEKKPLVVASLPKPEKLIKPRPAKKRTPKLKDVMAMFRAKPTQRGRPNAPKLKLSDEDADRIAKADLKKQMEDEEGEVISLDTRGGPYASYLAHLKRKIGEAWDPWSSKYPGDVRLKFVLREDGSLRRVELLHSSGYRILDDIAVAAVSEPQFKPFPPELRAKKKFLPISATFIYKKR